MSATHSTDHSETGRSTGYNLVHWGKAQTSPEAGVADLRSWRSGKLAAVRIYDDPDPPLNLTA